MNSVDYQYHRILFAIVNVVLSLNFQSVFLIWELFLDVVHFSYPWICNRYGGQKRRARYRLHLCSLDLVNSNGELVALYLGEQVTTKVSWRLWISTDTFIKITGSISSNVEIDFERTILPLFVNYSIDIVYWSKDSYMLKLKVIMLYNL